MAAAVIDQVHVIDARRAGRHAGEAGETAVDVLDGLCTDRLAALEHILDQVDAAARAVELVAEQDIGRAGRGAETAMHAGAQYLFRLPIVGIGKLREREAGLHRNGPQRSRYMRPGFSTRRGSKLLMTRALSAASAPPCGSKTGTALRRAAAPRTSVA